MKKRIIEIRRDPYIEEEYIYTKDKIELYPNCLTVLVGPNGAGKTTMLRQIQRQLKKEGVHYLEFDNEEKRKNDKSRAAYHENYVLLATLMESSEGQKIIVSINQFAGQIGNYILTKLSKNDTEIWIFMDATDSGLDINNIIKIKEELFSTVLDDKRLMGKDIYIVVTTNSYEYTTSFGKYKTDCISVKDCEHITFSDYQDYKEFITKGV